MGIAAAGFASMMGWQGRSVAQTSQKLASLDFERALTAVLANGAVCSYVLNNPPTSLNPMSLPTGPLVASISNIPSTPAAGAAPVANVGSPASALSNSLVVSSISLTDVNCSPAPCTAGSNTYNGNLTVSFDPTKLITQIAPLKFPVIFSTPGNAGSQTVTGCIGNTQAMFNCMTGGGTWNALLNTCSGGSAPTCTGLPVPTGGPSGPGSCAFNCTTTTPPITTTSISGVYVCAYTGWYCDGRCP
jgi:hypothetical protein